MTSTTFVKSMRLFIPVAMAGALSIASPVHANNFMLQQNLRNLNMNLQNQRNMEVQEQLRRQEVGAVQVVEVEAKIHKLCIEAKDYAGCVRSMQGDASDRTIRTINSQGADIAEGNQCSKGYAYIGGGNCQDVSCVYPAGPLGHDQTIAGLKDKNGKDVWSCKYDPWVYGAGGLRLSGAVTRATINKSCPLAEPKIGFNNTCQTASRDWLDPAAAAAKAKREGPKCDFKLKAFGCSYAAYLDANPGMKQWAELNPAMAAQERARLQSID